MTHLELFAGIGGFRRAMELIQKDGLMPFDNIGFSEINTRAIATYKANYDTSNEIELGDIVKFTSNPTNIKKLPRLDIITGGFPCQAFSMMGNMMGFEEDRGQIISIECERASLRGSFMFLRTDGTTAVRCRSPGTMSPASANRGPGAGSSTIATAEGQ